MLSGSKAIERVQNACFCRLDVDCLVREGWALLMGPMRDRALRATLIANPANADARAILDILELIQPHRNRLPDVPARYVLPQSQISDGCCHHGDHHHGHRHHGIRRGIPHDNHHDIRQTQNRS